MCSTPAKVIFEAKNMLSEYTSINQAMNNSASSSNSTPAWCPPPTGYVKLNVDAGYFTLTKKAKLAFVLQDEEGVALLCRLSSVPNVLSVFEVELLAI